MQKIITLLLVSTLFFSAKSEEKLNFQSVDSLTYSYYLSGDWDKLITTGKVALSQKIDFKFLRQRIGYAYFIKENYYASQLQYEKALNFDKNDFNSLLYLYYCEIMLGNETFAAYYLSKLPLETQIYFKEKGFKIINVVDAEYNFKINNIDTRSNPNYVRIGVGNQLSYRIHLYHSISDYRQALYSLPIEQFEYYGLLSCTLSKHTFINLGYHYLNTSSFDVRGKMIYSSIESKKNNFNAGISFSIMNDYYGNTIQTGIKGGINIPGKNLLKFQSSLYNISETNGNRIIFSQTAGGLLNKKLWLEGELTLGNLNNFTSKNGLYIYNSYDPTIFRSGITTFWYLLPKLNIVANYTFDLKSMVDGDTNYNQHSISGGILWKL